MIPKQSYPNITEHSSNLMIVLLAFYTFLLHRFYWLKVRALAESKSWLELDRFSKARKSPIGYEVRFCVSEVSFHNLLSNCVSFLLDPVALKANCCYLSKSSCCEPLHSVLGIAHFSCVVLKTLLLVLFLV